jgi:hypothetical protein
MKGRGNNVGSKNANAKLDASAVWRIRYQLKAGRRQKDVAKLANVSPQTINFIAKGRSWRSLVPLSGRLSLHRT